MRKRSFSLKYMLLTYRLDMLWLPAAFWALFLIITAMIREEPMGPPLCVAYLGTALPLVSGILAAYAVLDDPALELQFATPRPAWILLAERLGFIFLLAALCAVLYQVALIPLQMDLTPLGSLPARQLAWIVPTLAMIGLGAAATLANRQSMAGAAAVGIVWIFQIVMRDWFLDDGIARHFLLLMGSNYPDNPALRVNQAVLSFAALLLIFAAWALLRRQERYI